MTTDHELRQPGPTTPFSALAWRLALLVVLLWGGIMVFGWGCGVLTVPTGERCVDNEECTSGLCYQGSCVDVCSTTSGCTFPDLCDIDPGSTTGVCVACLTSADCGGMACTALGRCATCDPNDPSLGCGLGFLCWDGGCVATDADQLVNSQTVGDQVSPAVSVDSSGDTVVAWSTRSGRVLAQRFTSALVPAGGEIEVNEASVAVDGVPVDLAVDDDGDFVVVWEGALSGQAGATIYARLFDSDGIAQTGELQVDSTVTFDEARPSVGIAPEGVFVVAWQQPGADGLEISARAFTSAGVATLDAFQVNATTAGDQSEPDVVVGPEAAFAIAWMGPDNGDTGIYARFYGGSGALGGDVTVHQTAGDNRDPALAWAFTAGNVLVAWRTDGPDGAVYVRRFDTVGSAAGVETQVDTTAGGRRGPPDLAAALGGSLVVAWDAPDSSYQGVYMQRLGSDDAALGSETLVNVFTPQDQKNAGVGLAIVGGEFVIAWQSQLQDGSGEGVFARRFAADGTPLSLHGEVPTRIAAPLRTRRTGSAAGFGSAPAPSLLLGSNARGESPHHRLEIQAATGDLELYRAAWSYPADFGFNGFGALGPPGTVVGGFDLDAGDDGSTELHADLVCLDDDTAYLDVDGDRSPLGDPVVIHSTGTGVRFEAFVPLGGDGDESTLTVPTTSRISLELSAGLLVNPTSTDTFALQALLTSVDPDTDDADDGQGTAPVVLYAQFDALILESVLFGDDFESGDLSRWPAKRP